MFIYILLLIIAIIFIYLSEKNIYNNDLLRFLILICVSLFLFLIYVFRSINVGTDYKSYYSYFYSGITQSLSNVIEPGYKLLNHIAQYNNNFLIIPIFVFIVCFLGVYLLGIIFHLNKFLLLSFLILSYFYLSMFNGLRQFLAIGFICIGIFLLIKFNKTNLFNRILSISLYLLFIYIAHKFHSTAVFASIFLIFPFIRYGKKTVMISFILTIILSFTNIIRSLFGKILMFFPNYVTKYGNNNFAVSIYGHKAIMQLFPVVIQFIFLYIFVSRFKQNNSKIRFILSGYLLFLLMYSASGNLISDRLQLYTYIFQVLYSCLFINNFYYVYKYKHHNIVIYFFIIFWASYYIIRLLSNNSTVVPYSFI